MYFHDFLKKLYVKYTDFAEGLPNFRGKARLRLVLRDLIYIKKLNYEDNGYSATINGVKIKMKSKDHFEELLINSNTVEGYTMLRDVQRDDVVLDAGAFPGEFAIYAAKKGKKVLALEPDKENFDELRDNIKLNSLDNVVLMNKGLWSSEKRLSFDQKSGPGSSYSEEGSEIIETTTLDNIAEDEDLDFIKMDIEGAELEAIKGAESLIKGESPFFSIASYHDCDGKKTFRFLEDQFENQDYRCKTGFSAHLTTWAWQD